MTSLPRVPEPELMDDPEQALAYARADFAAVNEGFVERLLAAFPELAAGRALDLGCGPADIPIRLARARPGLRVVAVDGAASMIALARDAVAAAGLAGRVEPVCAALPGGLPADPAAFDAVISNSLLHHLGDPQVLWAAVAAAARPGAPVLVMDLRRPASAEALDGLVDTYAAGEPPVLRRDFAASLAAAFTPDEVRAQLAAAGLAHLAVAPVGDRHLVVQGRR